MKRGPGHDGKSSTSTGIGQNDTSLRERHPRASAGWQDGAGPNWPPSGSFDGLPPLLCEIAKVAGLHVALAFAEACGGTRVDLPMPTQLSKEHWLVEIVGREAAIKICKHFSAEHNLELELPRGPTGSRADRWRRLARLIAQGAPSGVITRRLGISRRTVIRHRSKRRYTDDRQPDLFSFFKEG
jgi:hypothetical protein